MLRTPVTTRNTEAVVATPINVRKLNIALDCVEPHIQNYLIEDFTTGYQADGTICRKMHTLPSAVKNKDITMHNIQAEIDAGRVKGPFNQPPLALSPIGLVPKKILCEFRLIHHLSYPVRKSVNDSIPDSAATVVYTSVGAAIDVILQLGRGCLMSKTDIEKAFRLIPIRNDNNNNNNI